MAGVLEVSNIDWRVDLVLASAEVFLLVLNLLLLHLHHLLFLHLRHLPQVGQLDEPLVTLILGDGQVKQDTLELELDTEEVDQLLARCKEILKVLKDKNNKTVE